MTKNKFFCFLALGVLSFSWTFSSSFSQERQQKGKAEDSASDQHSEDLPPLSLAFLNPFSFSAGNLTQFVNFVQTDETGEKNKVEVNPYIGLGYAFPLFSSDFSVLPSFAFAFPRTGRDENIQRTLFYLNTPLAYHLHSWTFKGGPGVFFTRITGKGGTLELRNGEQSDTFFVPSRSRTATNYTMNLGIDYAFIPQFSINGGVLIFSPFRSASRQWSSTLSFTFHLTGIFE